MTNNNNFIYEYYQKITEGTIIAGEWIKRLYTKIISDLEDKKYFYDHKKASRCIKFVENFCRHHEGKLAPNLVKLELWQKALLSVIFGCVDEDGSRHFREVFIVIGRKNGKTLLASCISTYMAFADKEYGANIYYTAPKLAQAQLCFNATFQTIKNDEDLNAQSQKRRTDIYIESSNTSLSPIAFSAKKSDGLNPQLTVCDEIASWEGDGGIKFYEVMKSALGARQQPLLLSISTAGYINDGAFDELFKRSTRVLNGESKENRLLPFIYCIDDIKKWNDINELAKSNPNLNVSVSVDYMLEEIAIAEQSIPKKGEFLTKYCNIKQSSSLAWLNANVINDSISNELRFEDFKDCYAVGGIDLSRTTDLTACTCVIEKKGTLYVFAKFFMPAEKVEEAIARDQLPYHIFAQKGFLQLSGDNFVDYKDCYKWFTDLIEKYKIYPLKIGYDRYSANYLVQDLKGYGFHMDDVYQGFNLTPVIREFEGLIKDKKICIGNNDLLKIHLLNTALKLEGETEKVRIIKIAQQEHIDGTAALLDAMCVRQKWYSEIGMQLENKGK